LRGNHNQIESIAEQVAGGRLKYRELSSVDRDAVRATAARMYELGVDVPTAARAQATELRGFVYIITNPAFPDWVKIGRAFDPESRLKGYQTGSPHRDYKLEYAVYFKDCVFAEREIHARLKPAYPRSGEWFRINASIASMFIDQLRETI